MKSVLDALLKRFIYFGSLSVTYSDGTVRQYQGERPGRRAAVRILTAAAERALALKPALAFGEEYMNGTVVPDGCSLEDVLWVIIPNVERGGLLSEDISGRLRYVSRVLRPLNSLKRSRSNVAHHYDLNGSLYELFLDKDRQYSCAYFEHDGMSLDDAQRAKKRHIAAKLNLNQPGLEVLDIGCGWGGMALTLARDYGAKVTGITLSVEQLQVARKRAQDEKLDHLVSFELLDYRTLKKQFDRIVSVGMFEHVGVRQYETFFNHIKRLLKPDGVAVIHSIGRMDGPGMTNPWISKYIFPGGYSPALSETLAALEQIGLWLTDCEVWRLHYAKTLAHWRKRFDGNREKIRALYDDRFVRMFELYLLASELAFRIQGHMNFQLQITRGIEAVPLTRDYMFEAENAQREKARAKTGG
ncbi:class I SAM-dependent methyltransferase [Parasaccharibacter sp. TMW 2.1888]|uniref:SAM-dependent methyltransferase n=1 Tax=Parasaccharibacter sp. TMW 2.1888 TaxID=2268025 RepID=UPI00206DE8AB|nr:cyclopropane-fatty-acyl-phospholipid synthase family protein [Parasaccharibacter sp. TMW 2.1888]UPO79264.1 class I SAM-dependent methyltransferase [Parasaccharibacter sp. TMW 2.1888]